MKLRKAAIIVSVFLFTGALLFAGGQTSATAGEYGTPGQFPLEKTLTLRMGVENPAYDPTDNPIVKMWEEETNVHLDFVSIENDEKRNIIYASDDYPDMQIAQGLWKNLVAGLLNEGVVYDLVPFLKQG